MKLNALHEAKVVSIRPHILGSPRSQPDIFRPTGPMRWYLSFSEDAQPSEDGLTEDEKEKKAGRQFGDQTSQPKTKVWQPLEGHEEVTNPELYFPKGTKKAAPPRWTSPKVPPPDKDHSDFILKSGK